MFGTPIAFCEPSWYHGSPSAYYNQNHAIFRDTCREFIETRIKPYSEDWIKQESYPLSLHQEIYDYGLIGHGIPAIYGGIQQQKDPFLFYILIDELARIGGGGILGHIGINSMVLPLILNYGSDLLKKLVIKPVITGYKNLSLAISEPTAGSDVSNIKTTARKDGDIYIYIVNGQKKWISGAYTADYLALLVRTIPGDMLSVLLVNCKSPGVMIRKMNTQFDSSFSTCFIEFDNVKVPITHLIGKEGNGFKMILTNFNHERFIIAVGACRNARICYEEAIKYAMRRKTFNKRLVDHQLVRYKLSSMARMIEMLQDNCDRVCYQFYTNVPDIQLGPICALLKVNASETFEYCSRESSQILGGNSIIKGGGQGRIVERLSREVRSFSIPGGSNEILLDMAIRKIIPPAEIYKCKL